MTRQFLEFDIPMRGAPASNKKVVTKTADGGHKIRDAGKGKKNVFALVRLAADMATQKQGWTLTDGPIWISVTFMFSRPKKHFGEGKNAQKLKSSAPLWPNNKSCGDRTNLFKCLEDALTGIVWKDDSQVVSGPTERVYGDTDHVFIQIRELDNRITDSGVRSLPGQTGFLEPAS